MENVSVTTIERKQMSQKTALKRIALGVVVALGFGALASGPSNAAITTGSTFSISATSASITAGETATATLTGTFTSINSAASDSMAVTFVRTTGTTDGGAQSIKIASSAIDTVAVSAYVDSTDSLSWANATVGNQVTAKWKFTFSQPTTAGTYGYTLYPTLSNGTSPAPVTFTITVAAKNIKPSATFSKVGMTSPGNTVLFTADSTIVVPAGLAASPDSAAVFGFDQRNSSDTNTVTGTTVYESVTAVVSGPGLLSLNGSSTRLRAVTTMNTTDTIVAWSDGAPGKGTITFSTTTMSVWASKSVTFTGTLASASISAFKAVTAAGNSDTQTAIRVVPKDSGDNVVTTSQTMYVHSSDTKVVENTACTVKASASLGYGNCALDIKDSGTTNIKIANYAFGTAAASLPTVQVVTNEVSITVAGAAASVAISFDKRSYIPGEKAIITVTVTDGNGRAVADQAIASLFATGGITVSPSLSQGTVSAETVTVTAATYGQGKFTYTVNMPTNAAQVVASATGGVGLVAAGRVAVGDTVTVINPAEDAANSALDAAQEATDAAIAATDAAILAQEAADEAASAAIAAQETAQAAVDAVTALSAEVTKLVAQLATLQKLLNRVAKRVGVKL
jgi:hypothetical protein